MSPTGSLPPSRETKITFYFGAAVLKTCRRSLIFGGIPTVRQYKNNPAVQVHGPGFSKILLGDDHVDRWEDYLDIMVDSVLVNSGRSCINCSGI